MNKKTALKFILFIACFIILERSCYKATDGFRIYKIASDLPYHAEWDTGMPTPEIETLLDQPFYYLASGGQSYAFCSKDNSTVIKFFKHHHMRPDSWTRRIVLPGFLDKWRNRTVKKHHKRLVNIFNSGKLAHDEFKEETGIIYLHLNKTHLFNKKINLIDKLGIAHPIDIDAMEFVLQKRAELTFPRLDELKKSKDLETAKRCIDSLLNLMITRSKRGIEDKDPILSRNFGYIDGERAVEIDIGSFRKKEKIKSPYLYKKIFLEETLKLQLRVRRQYPELLPHLYDCIEALLLE